MNPKKASKEKKDTIILNKSNFILSENSVLRYLT